MIKKSNVQHPGIRLAAVLSDLNFSVTEAAKSLGVTRTALSRLLHCHSGVSIEMARRLEACLGVENGTAEHWLTMQMRYDLTEAERLPIQKVDRLA